MKATRKNPNTHTLTPPTTLFPTRRQQRLTYNAAGYLNLAANSYMSTEFFNVTGPYDPDYSNYTRNSSAYGWTYFFGTAIGQYANYLVHAAHVKLVFSSVTQATTNVCVSTTDYLGVGSDYASSATSTATQVSQRKMSTLFVMDNTNNSARAHTVEFDVFPWQVIGVSRAQYMTDRTFWGGSGANPANTGAFVALSMSDALENGTNSSESIQYTIEISFDLEMFGVAYA